MEHVNQLRAWKKQIDDAGKDLGDAANMGVAKRLLDHAIESHEQITKLREQVAAQAAEIARLKTVPMKYRRMQFNAELQEEATRLREQVAAQAAVIERLTKRLASTNIIIEVVCATHPDSACAKYELAENMNALSIPTDSTQILDEVRRAERERVYQVADNAYATEHVLLAIRAME